jgi:hypothetical protein
MKNDPPNPYRDATLRELRDAASFRAGDLLKEGVPVGRLDTAYLLIAAAFRLSPQSLHPNSPVNRGKAGESVLEVFWPEFESDAKATRHHLLMQAIEATGLTFEQIREYQTRTGLSLTYLAAEEDDGLRQALMHLEAIRLKISA